MIGGIRTGQTAVTAGAAVPLLGITYNTDLVSGTVGDNHLTGGATDFTTISNIGATGPTVGYQFYIRTAAGNRYEIAAVLSATRLRLKSAVITEASIATGVTYTIYQLPQTSWISLLSEETTTTNLLYVGPRGAVSATTGLVLAPTSAVRLNLNLADNDMWIDASVGTLTLSWALGI